MRRTSPPGAICAGRPCSALGPRGGGSYRRELVGHALRELVAVLREEDVEAGRVVVNVILERSLAQVASGVGREFL